MSSSQARLVVAVTGPTGTFGFGLVPLLESEQRVARIVGIARRPFDPAEHGWSKMEYRRGDVRDPDALRQAFEGSDVVVHLAFMITGTASAQKIRAVNVEGTLNAFRAARDVRPAAHDPAHLTRPVRLCVRGVFQAPRASSTRPRSQPMDFIPTTPWG